MAVALVTGASTPVALAQVHGGPMPNRVPAKQPKRAEKLDKAGGAPRRPGPAAGQHPLDYWSSLSPEERQIQLAKLPPERAQQLEKGVDRWSKMTPQQKEVARSMTPEKRKIMTAHREWLLQQPEERQKAIRKQTQMLQQMSPEARLAELDSQTFKNRFDPAEREHIKKIVSIIPEANSNVEY